jgi:hypothetical protein
MRKLNSFLAIATLITITSGCVTYTPISVPTPPTRRLDQSAQPARPTPNPFKPIQVPPPIPDTVNIAISPDTEPTADEGGVKLIEAYAEAIRNIKAHNKNLKEMK